MFELQAKSKTKAEIRLFGTVADWGKISPEQVDDALQAAVDKGYKEVIQRLHSPGGEIFAGTAITSSMDFADIKITTRVEGIAASYGSVILQRSDWRQMVQGTRLMIHSGSGGAYGNASQIDESYKELKAWNEEMATIYSEKTGKSKEWILENWMKDGKDVWFSAEEALEAGLIDEIIPRKGKKITLPKDDASLSMEQMSAYYEEQLFENNDEDKMKEKLIEKYRLKSDATEQEVMAAIEADKAQGDTEPSDLAVAESLDAFIAMGKTAGLITDKNESQVKTMAGKAGLKATSEFLATTAPEANPKNDGVRISELVTALKGYEDPKGKTWDNMSLEEKEALEKSDPEKFDALFQAYLKA